MAFRGHRPVRRVSVKRQSLWLALDFAEDTITGATATLIATLNAAALALRPFTIVRSHLSFYLKSDQAAANESQTVAFGLTVVTDQAIAAGIASIPTPATDQSSDWFFHKWMMANAVNLTDQTKAGVYFEQDSKAMRKVDIGSDLAFVIENPTALGMALGSAGRILIKTN